MIKLKYDKLIKTAKKKLKDQKIFETVSIEEIKNIIRQINDVIFAGPVNLYIGSMEDAHKHGDIEDEDFQLLKPILESWKLESGSWTQSEFVNFKDELDSFSQQVPQFFEGGVSMLNFFDTYIIEKSVGPYYNQLIAILDKFNEKLKSRENKYSLIISTDFLTLSPFDFEELIGELFEAKGFYITVTQKTGDFGVDVLAKREHDIIAIQAKKYSIGNNIGNRDVQRLLGAMHYHEYKANSAILITTSDFTDQAKKQAFSNPITLWNKKKLISEIEKYLL